MCLRVHCIHSEMWGCIHILLLFIPYHGLNGLSSCRSIGDIGDYLFVCQNLCTWQRYVFYFNCDMIGVLYSYVLLGLGDFNHDLRHVVAQNPSCRSYFTGIYRVTHNSKHKNKSDRWFIATWSTPISSCI